MLNDITLEIVYTTGHFLAGKCRMCPGSLASGWTITGQVVYTACTDCRSTDSGASCALFTHFLDSQTRNIHWSKSKSMGKGKWYFSYCRYLWDNSIIIPVGMHGLVRVWYGLIWLTNSKFNIFPTVLRLQNKHQADDICISVATIFQSQESAVKLGTHYWFV